MGIEIDLEPHVGTNVSKSMKCGVYVSHFSCLSVGLFHFLKFKLVQVFNIKFIWANQKAQNHFWLLGTWADSCCFYIVVASLRFCYWDNFVARATCYFQSWCSATIPNIDSCSVLSMTNSAWNPRIRKSAQVDVVLLNIISQECVCIGSRNETFKVSMGKLIIVDVSSTACCWGLTWCNVRNCRCFSCPKWLKTDL